MKTKPNVDIEETIEKFKPQHELLQCLPACLMNIHNELFRRIGKDEKISLSEAGDICGYEKGLGCNEFFLVEKIDERINKYNYRAKEEYHIKDGITLLEKVLSSGEISFPVVTFSGRYWDEIASTSGPSTRRMGHSVIVLGMNGEEIIYYEPAENYISSEDPDSFNPRSILKPRFQELWNDFVEPNWILWYEPRKTRILEDFLEEDDERKIEYHIENYRKR